MVKIEAFFICLLAFSKRYVFVFKRKDWCVTSNPTKNIPINLYHEKGLFGDEGIFFLLIVIILFDLCQ